MRGSVSEGTVGCRSAWRPRHLLPDKPGAGQALLFLLNSQMYPPNRVILFMNLKNEVRADSLGTSQWIPPQAQSRGLKLASSRGGRGGGFVKGKHSLRCVSFSNRWEKKNPRKPRDFGVLPLPAAFSQPSRIPARTVARWNSLPSLIYFRFGMDRAVALSRPGGGTVIAETPVRARSPAGHAPSVRRVLRVGCGFGPHGCLLVHSLFLLDAR